MPTTSNFGWTTPADTDLVKDGAAAIRTLGNGIDTSLVDLKGGTTGQILSKNSNTDLDYTWVTPNVGDITEVQAGTGISVASGTGPIPVVTNDMATTITAAGDIVVGTGSGTYDNLPIGTTGQVLTADTTVSPYKVKWATASSGGMTQLATGSLSGASVSMTPISGSYKELRVVIRNYKPATNDIRLQMRINNDSNANRYTNTTSTFLGTGQSFGGSAIEIQCNQNSSTANGLQIITLPDYTNTATWQMVDIIAIGNDATTATNVTMCRAMGMYNQAGAVTRLDFFPASGNFTSGDYILYGVS